MNTKILKNSLFLIIRLFLNIFASIYITRELIYQLGVEDFGVFNIVGGVVLTLTFILTSLSSAISRFFNIYLGQGKLNLSTIYSISLNLHVVVAIIVLFIGILIHDFIIYDFLNIPDERKTASLVVFFCTLVILVVNLIKVTYTALMISHEHIKEYSFIGVIDIFLKLVLVSILDYFMYDNLIVYAYLLVLNSVIMLIVYIFYTNRVYRGINYVITKEYKIYKKIISFVGWNAFGSLSLICRDQGVNLLLNLFFSPTINAARAIAYQLNSAISSLSSQVSIAVSPQITQNISCGRHKDSFYLIKNASKYTFSIVYLFFISIYFSIDELLYFWLGTVPDYTSDFSVLMIFILTIDTISSPLITALLAFGSIRRYQITVGVFNLSNLPICYSLLSLGFSPVSCFYVAIFISFICLLCRVYLLDIKMSGFAREFIKEVIKPIFIYSILGYFIIDFIIMFISVENDILRFVFYLLITLTVLSMLAYFIILDSEHKVFLKKKIREI